MATISTSAGLRGLLGRHWAVVVVAAVYLACLAILPLDGIWINDVGSRVIEMKSILTSHYSDFSVRWPGVSVDPSFHYTPIAYPFAAVRQGKLFSLYEPLLPALASPFYGLFGYPGLYVLPFVGSLAMLVGLGRLASEIGLGERARNSAIFLCAVSTPVWFYSLTFWEHTMAIAFCVWSVVRLLRFLRLGLRRDLLGAAGLSAAATYFRPELYCFSFVLLLLVFRRAPARKAASAALFVAASVATLVPLWIFLWITVGAPFGLHLGTFVSSAAGVVQHVRYRPSVFYHLFLLASSNPASSVLFSAPFLALLIVRPKLPPRAFKVAFPLLALLALVISFLIWRPFLGTSQTRSPIAFVGNTNSLFPAAPFLILGLVRCRRSADSTLPVRSPADTVWLLALVYALVYWLAAPEVTKWGIHWGNRLVLVLYPLLAVLVAANLSDWQHVKAGKGVWSALSHAAVGMVVIASIGAQIWSITILQRKMDYSARLNREVGARPEQVVVSYIWWVGQELYDQFQAKLIFLVSTDQQHADLMTRLAQQGHSKYLAVLPANEPIPSGWGRQRESTRVPDNGLNYWDVNLVALDIRPDRR